MFAPTDTDGCKYTRVQSKSQKGSGDRARVTSKKPERLAVLGLLLIYVRRLATVAAWICCARAGSQEEIGMSTDCIVAMMIPAPSAVSLAYTRTQLRPTNTTARPSAQSNAKVSIVMSPFPSRYNDSIIGSEG